MKIALLGTGFGLAHARIYHAHPEVTDVVVFGRTPAKLEKCASEFGFATTADIEAIYTDPGIDLVDVCLPTPLHADHVARALEVGKDALCELPLATTMADARRIVEAQTATGRQVFVDMFSMKLVSAQLVGEAASGEHHHKHPGGEGDEHQHEHAGTAHPHEAGGIEWEDDMVEVNRMTTPANTRWKLIDRSTGAAGAAIDWRFRVGDQVKIRLVNEMDSDHPMHHPFHIHGAGRFLILSRNGVIEPNLVWKDTVLLPTGQSVDILLDVTNPGLWMAHCHIAEHHESGMMFSFEVEP